VTTIGLDIAQDWRVVAPGQARVSGARRRRRGPDGPPEAAGARQGAFFANLPRRVIGLEACGGAHD
jgi:transposase